MLVVDDSCRMCRFCSQFCAVTFLIGLFENAWAIGGKVAVHNLRRWFYSSIHLTSLPTPFAIPTVRERNMDSAISDGSFSARASMRNAWRRFDVVMNARLCIERSHVKQ